MKPKKKKVMVFGVFDKFHAGHRHFLTQAKALGDDLIIVVARDEMVHSLKNRAPAHTLTERINNIKIEMSGSTVIPGDEKPNQWILLKEIRPDVIALGYDQKALEKVLNEKKTDFSFKFEIVKLEGHKSHIYHTSLLG